METQTKLQLEGQNRKDTSPSVFSYLGFREYLKAYYDYRKNKSASFSYKLFSEKTGIASPNYMKLIIDGDRKITLPHARKVARFCKLGSEETRYFILLVKWDLSQEDEERGELWREISLHRTQTHTVLDNNLLELFTRWEVAAIWELSRIRGFVPDGKFISESLGGKVSSDQCQQIVELLLEKKLILCENGHYFPSETVLKSPEELPSKLLRDSHAEKLKLAIEAQEKFTTAEKEFESITVTIKKSDLPYLKSEMRKFTDRILSFSAETTDPDEVYQLNLNFFPLTKNKRGNHEGNA